MTDRQPMGLVCGNPKSMIELECEARGLDTVGQDGRKVVAIESIVAAHCAIDAKNAYLKARDKQ